MSFTGPLEDRIAIRERHDMYADASTRGDREAWLDCWTPDCVWITALGESRGHAALAEQWDKLWENFESIVLFIGVGAIEVEGNRARSRAYVREMTVPKVGPLSKFVGQYDDELVRIDGVWRYAHRRNTPLIFEKPE